MAVAKRPWGWQATVDVGRDPLTGKRRRVSESFATQRLAEQWAARQRPRVVARKGMTVGDLLEDWLAQRAPELSPNTVRGYRGVIDRYLSPGLGTLLLHKLGSAQIDALYAAMRARGLSRATVRRTHACLSGACGQALRHGLVVDNPCELAAALPEQRRTKAQGPDVTAVAQVWGKAGPWLRDVILLAIVTGARRGELCGLTWSDLNGDRLRIARAIAFDGSVLTDARKSPVRVVALPELALVMLARRRAEVMQDCLAAGEPFDPNGWIFTMDRDSSLPANPGRITLAWSRARGDTKVRFHDLRHLSVTSLLNAHISLPNVASRHGHESGNVTLAVYGHADEEVDQQAAQIMGAVARVITGARATS